MTYTPARTAKNVSFYLSAKNSAIETLIARYGEYLERVFPQHKMMMVAILADHMAAAGSSDYPIASSLESIDPDHLLDAPLSRLIVRIAEESDVAELNDLIVAIVAQHGDNIRAGAYQ